jgi:hypothetical protein
MGKRAALGAWSVGTPEFSLWEHYTPVLQACRDYNAVLSRHSYWPLNQWYALRHRLDELEFQKLGYINTPVVLSECGADGIGGMGGQWRALWGDDVGEYYSDYLKPFESELQKDCYVLGATLFTVGTGFSPAWQPFDVSGTNLPQIIAADNPPPPQGGYTHIVNASALNVRAHPWTGDKEPPILWILPNAALVRVYGVYCPDGMQSRWASISPCSDGWVSARYLTAL